MSKLKEALSELRKLAESRPVTFEGLANGYIRFEEALKDIKMSLEAILHQFDLGAGKGPVAEMEKVASDVLDKFGGLTEAGHNLQRESDDAKHAANIQRARDHGALQGVVNAVYAELERALANPNLEKERPSLAAIHAFMKSYSKRQ